MTLGTDQRVIRKLGNTAGFTLVELLLAIALMSILLGLVYGGLRAATRSAQQGETRLAKGGELRTAHQFVRRQLNQMLQLPFAVTDDDAATRILFEGDPSHIQFVAPMPGYLGAGGPQVQLLELTGGHGGRVLQFSHALLQGFEPAQLLEREPVVLLEDVDTASFEFLQAGENGATASWIPSWEQPGKLPLAVRLSLEFVEPVLLLWPELVAGVRLDEQAINNRAGRQPYEQAIQDLINRGGESQP